MISERTTFSNWVYRAALVLLLIGAWRYAQYMYATMSPSLADTEGAVYWTSFLSLMSGAISMAVAAIAMAVRSGAVVWLLGLQFVLTVATLAPSLTMVPDRPVVAVLFLGVVLALLALGAVTFTYLIRKGEIRRP